MDNLNKTCELISNFLQPISEIQQTDLIHFSFELLIKKLICQFRSGHENFFVLKNIPNNLNDTFWEFGLISLNLFDAINVSIVSSDSSFLSVTQERHCVILCQLIESFCIHYNLESNIGVPIDRLSKYGANISIKREDVDLCSRNNRLNIVLEKLWKIKKNQKSDYKLINRYFYRKSLHSIICSLLQTVYSPYSSPKNISFFIEWLDEIFEETDSTNIINAIMMAQYRYIIKFKCEII